MLRYANLALLALFPLAWFAPLLRAGLLPLFMFDNDRQAAFFFGEPLKVLAGSNLLTVHAVYSQQPDIRALRDLEGRTVGVGPLGALTHQLIYAALLKHGVDPAKVKFVPMGSSSTTSAGTGRACGQTTWSRSPMPRTSGAARGFLPSTGARRTAMLATRSQRRTRGSSQTVVESAGHATVIASAMAGLVLPRVGAVVSST